MIQQNAPPGKLVRVLGIDKYINPVAESCQMAV